MSHNNRSLDVIVHGTLCLDLLWRMPALPAPGGYAEIAEERKSIGGEAANTAIALQRWGVKTALVVNEIGQDSEGALLRTLIERDAPELDIRTSLNSPTANTPYCICIATDDGKRTMYGRYFDGLTVSDLDPALALDTRLFTSEPNAYQSACSAARIAHTAGAGVVLMDFATDDDMNRISTVAITSTDHIGCAEDEQALIEFARSTRGRTGPTVIVTRGDRGCIAADAAMLRAEVTLYPAFKAPRLVDTTGCGDIFRAGVLFGQLSGWDLRQTIRFASAAAALKCGEMGGWAGVRPVDEILSFIKTQDWSER